MILIPSKFEIFLKIGDFLPYFKVLRFSLKAVPFLNDSANSTNFISNLTNLLIFCPKMNVVLSKMFHQKVSQIEKFFITVPLVLVTVFQIGTELKRFLERSFDFGGNEVCT